MSIYHAIKYIYPGIRDDQFRLQDDSDGRGPYIARWEFDQPEPTPAQIEQAIATMPPPWAADLKAEFREERELLANRLGTIASRKHRQGDTAFAQAIDWMVEQIIPLDAHPYVVAQAALGYEQGRAAYKAAYRQIAGQALATAPDEATRLVWKAEVDKMFPKD